MDADLLAGYSPVLSTLSPVSPFLHDARYEGAYFAYVDSIYPPIPYPENVAHCFERVHPEPAPTTPAQDVLHDSESSEDDDLETESEMEIDDSDPDYDPRHDG